MIRKQLIAAFALLVGGFGLAQSDAFGYWNGTIGPGVLDLEINILIEGSPEAPTALLDIPAQGLFSFPLSDVIVDGDAVTFAMAGIPGNPVFAGTVEGDSITGTFTQSGQEFDFEVERGEAEEAGLIRPQEPERPFPYMEEEVSVVSPAGDVTLAGTLTLPEGDGPFTAILFITGSGPQDRNEELFGHKPFLVLSDALTRAGYATLRLDDRGIGGSEGLDADASYEDMTADAVAAVGFLRERAEVGQIGLLGHSQGGYLAPLVALETDIDFVISLAGPAVDGLEVLELQNRYYIEGSVPADGNVSTEEVETAIQGWIDFLRDVTELFEAGDLEAARERMRAEIAPAYASLPEEDAELFMQEAIAGTVNNAMVSFMTFDPQPSLRQLTVPVLAIFGGLDIQVDAEQSVGPLEAALEAAGNDDFTITVIEDMNHILQPAVSGQLEEYPLIETTVHEDVLELILGWLEARY